MSFINQIRWGAFVGLLSMLSLGLSGCVPPCEDIGYCDVVENARVNVTFYGFSSTQVGGEQVREIYFESVGRGTLRVNTVELVEEDGDGQEELHAVGWDGDRWDGPVFRMNPGESATLAVAYRPEDEVEDRGYVEVLTNDPDQRELRIDLAPPAPRAEIFASPSSLTWPSIPPDTDPDWRGEPRTLEVQNSGTAPLDVSEIRVEGDDVFGWALQQCTGAPDGGQLCLPEDDVEALPDPISPGESAFLRVYYRPIDRLPDSAKLLISSNSDGGETTEISLKGG
jgi:hypothetical protein